MTRSVTTVPKETKHQKALRLIADDKLAPCHSTTFIVNGDDGNYVTTVLHLNDEGGKGDPYMGSCTCKYMREKEIYPSRDKLCSHLTAAMTLAKRKAKE